MIMFYLSAKRLFFRLPERKIEALSKHIRQAIGLIKQVLTVFDKPFLNQSFARHAHF